MEGVRMQLQPTQPIFDYRTLRLLVGVIAFALPFVVTIIASESLPSVSASYFSEARDLFVGLMFIVSAFLLAYNGHSIPQAIASKVAAVAAACVAIFPTSKTCEPSTWVSITHTASAVVLLSILVYFCLGPFRKNTWGMGGRKRLRVIVYVGCGLVMIGAMLAGAYGMFVLGCDEREESRIIYWVEAIALVAFGVAWFVAGKWLRFMVDGDEELRFFQQEHDSET